MKQKTGADFVAEAMKDVPSLSCEEYEAFRAKGEKHIFLDVREKEEFEQGHVEGAILVPRGVIEFKIPEVIPEKDEQVIICCRSGGRAALAGRTLIDMGYKNIKFLEGGYSGYCAAKE